MRFYVYRVHATLYYSYPSFPHRFFLQSTLKLGNINVIDTSNFYVTSLYVGRTVKRDDLGPVVSSIQQVLTIQGYFYLVTKQRVILPSSVKNIQILNVELAKDLPNVAPQQNVAVFTKDIKEADIDAPKAIIQQGQYYIKVCNRFTLQCSYIPAFYDNSKSENWENVLETIPSPFGYQLQNKPLIAYPQPTECTVRLLQFLTNYDMSENWEIQPCGQIQQKQEQVTRRRVRRGRRRNPRYKF